MHDITHIRAVRLQMPYFFALTIVAVSDQVVTLAFVGKSRRPATTFEPRYEEALEEL